MLIASLLLAFLPLCQGTPWVNPDDVGSSAPYADVKVQVYGFYIGLPAPSGVIGIPLTAQDLMLGAHDGAVTSNNYAGSGGPLDWRNSRFHGFGFPNNKWGMRAYDALDYTFLKCTWDTLGSPTSGADGHGCYVNPVASLRWDQCHFDDCTGQGIQVVYATPWIEGSPRQHETGLQADIYLRLLRATVKTDWHEVIACAFTQVGDFTKSERASYAASFFEVAGRDGPIGHPVKIANSYFKTELPYTDANGVERDCQGAIMIHGRYRAWVEGNYIEFKKGTKGVIQVWGCSDGVPGTPDVVIAGNAIKASQAIDIRLATPEDTVIVGRNRGTTTVRIWSADSEWYAWPPTQGTLLYEGPVSDNYRLN